MTMESHGYPKITQDIIVYAGFRDARLDIPEPSQAQSDRRPPTCSMKKTCMPDLTRRRWSKPSTNSCSCWRSKFLLPHSACYAELRCNAHALFGETHIAGCPMISWVTVIPCCIWNYHWNILINCHLCRIGMAAP